MAHEKRLLIDVFQAYFYRRNKEGDRELVFMSENLTSGSISSTQNNADVRNGQGNTLFAILPGDKDVTVNLTENVFSFEALKVNTAGIEQVNVESQGITSVESHRAGTFDMAPGTGGIAAKSVAQLIELPVNEREISIQIGDVVLTNGNANGKAADTITAGEFYIAEDDAGTAYTAGVSGAAYLVLHEDDAAKLVKERIKIMPYVYRTEAANTSVLTINSKEFAEGGELWLQTIEKDEKQKATAYVYFVFENAMPEGNFEINTVSEVQPNDMTVNMRILANEDGELYRIVREEI